MPLQRGGIGKDTKGAYMYHTNAMAFEVVHFFFTMLGVVAVGLAVAYLEDK